MSENNFVDSLRRWFTSPEEEAAQTKKAVTETERLLAKTANAFGVESFDLESTTQTPSVQLEIDTDRLDNSTPEQKHVRAKHTISVLSGKGGVGKTSSLIGLAGAAATRGLKVLLVDLDPQGSLTTAALDRDDAQTALLAFHGKTLAELAVPAVWKDFKGLIHIVPARRTLAAADFPVQPKTHESQLATALGDVSAYDLVLIDAPSTLGALTLEAVALATNVVVVAEPTLFSLRGASDAVDFAISTKRARKGWRRRVHVMLNKVDSSEESSFRVREIHRLLPNLVLKSTITDAKAINNAIAHGLPVSVFAGVAAARASAEYDALLDELLV